MKKSEIIAIARPVPSPKNKFITTSQIPGTKEFVGVAGGSGRRDISKGCR